MLSKKYNPKESEKNGRSFGRKKEFITLILTQNNLCIPLIRRLLQ